MQTLKQSSIGLWVLIDLNKDSLISAGTLLLALVSAGYLMAALQKVAFNAPI
ncbi:MAG: hypothetical protein AAFX00_01785 [Pseudomonadota bacterium]